MALALWRTGTGQERLSGVGIRPSNTLPVGRTYEIFCQKRGVDRGLSAQTRIQPESCSPGYGLPAETKNFIRKHLAEETNRSTI